MFQTNAEPPVALDLSASFTTPATSVINLDKASIHIDWSGSSPEGVLTVEARNGESDDWYTLEFGAAIDITGNTGNHQLVFNELPFTDIRLVYTRTSGTGSATANLTAKVSGA